MKRVIRPMLAALLCVFTLQCTAQTQAADLASRAASSQFSNLPLRRDEPAASIGNAPVWVALTLVGVFAAIWFARRRGAGGLVRPTAVAVSPGRALTAQASLHVVEWEGETMLVACTAHSVTVVSRRAEGKQ